VEVGEDVFGDVEGKLLFLRPHRLARGPHYATPSRAVTSANRRSGVWCW
jgi:hypothetical protein